FFQRKADKYAEEGNYKGIERVHWMTGLGMAAMLGILVTISYAAGSEAMSAVLNAIPGFVQTGLNVAIGLLPAALSHGIGSESQRPLAIVIIGGLIGATFFTLFVFPLMVEAFYRRMLYDKNGKLVQRRL
ncbi:MAG: efflux RND transporter permease subunit, partial [Parabacteroides distasonis]|nr:efflux RND transporter permease subunit [Parabacteroides distasonis]